MFEYYIEIFHPLYSFNGWTQVIDEKQYYRFLTYGICRQGRMVWIG